MPNSYLILDQLLKCVRLPSVRSLAAVLLTCRMGEKTIRVSMLSMFDLDATRLQNRCLCYASDHCLAEGLNPFGTPRYDPYNFPVLVCLGAIEQRKRPAVSSTGRTMLRPCSATYIALKLWNQCVSSSNDVAGIVSLYRQCSPLISQEGQREALFVSGSPCLGYTNVAMR